MSPLIGQSRLHIGSDRSWPTAFSKLAATSLTNSSCTPLVSRYTFACDWHVARVVSCDDELPLPLAVWLVILFPVGGSFTFPRRFKDVGLNNTGNRIGSHKLPSTSSLRSEVYSRCSHIDRPSRWTRVRNVRVHFFCRQLVLWSSTFHNRIRDAGDRVALVILFVKQAWLVWLLL